MQYRRLGRSGTKVSEISLGSWLTYGGSVGRETAISCVHRAYDIGINFFDTANVYHRGAAETVLGEALKGLPRTSYVLATKAFWPMGDGPNDRGLSRKHIIEQCNLSLQRLGVDYVDLFQCHRYDPETPLDETLRAMDDLIRQGKVLYAGVSEWSAVQIDDALHTADQRGFDRIVSNQPQYSMLERYIEKDILPLCEREGVGQVVWSPLAQGMLTGKYKRGQNAPEGSRAATASTSQIIGRLMTDENFTKVEQLQEVANRNEISLAQLALAWILRQKNVSSAIIGASRPEQVDENAKASDVTLSVADLEHIETILA
ncbi:MAG: aldo/keto reductase family protein [Acidibacillus sp.]|uniref:L-glyceraldehyde 3-phosphate reductase n=1 Tax=Sulfoacidibacillus ferrooxidans TaxID=2005001 RepID=A0A9X1VB88_9BACL|nr:L-glyceraldehyde 3-phosphate reductase [Sulfoacidibacillus ferrooxidans]MCY0893288.1 aldo/keto reductase family protein [Acidibacillus sp.]